jgi:small neutral amino acid transporter SnatA (MarC family)
MECGAMLKFKYTLAAALIAAQAILPFITLSEYLLRGLSIPYFSFGIVGACILMMVTMKDADKRHLFSSDRITKWGPFYFFSFDVLKHLKS